tara:strand:+ start:295 stop:501 length:207 start_codon:yes stop_codon:yes gene_type:complete
MKTINVEKNKLGKVLDNVETLLTDFETLVGDQDMISKQRLKEIKEAKVEGKTEGELDNYLKKGGVKIE